MRACKVCKTRFEGKGFIVWCSAACGTKIALARLEKKRKAQAKAERKTDRERKVKLKTRSDYVKEAQSAFNRYVRFRDASNGCISCGVHLGGSAVGGAYDCGHFRSVGSARHLRFHEDNAHGQCKRCNRWDSGNHSDYRVGLIVRIGQERVDALEADQEPRHYTIEDLKAIKTKYRALARQLEKD
jgi:hypothetical protein